VRRTGLDLKRHSRKPLPHTHGTISTRLDGPLLPAYAPDPLTLTCFSFSLQLICGFLFDMYDSLKYSTVKYVLAPIQSSELEECAVRSFNTFVRALSAKEDKPNIQIVRPATQAPAFLSPSLLQLSKFAMEDEHENKDRTAKITPDDVSRQPQQRICSSFTMTHLAMPPAGGEAHQRYAPSFSWSISPYPRSAVAISKLQKLFCR